MATRCEANRPSSAHDANCDCRLRDAAREEGAAMIEAYELAFQQMDARRGGGSGSHQYTDGASESSSQKVGDVSENFFSSKNGTLPLSPTQRFSF